MGLVEALVTCVHIRHAKMVSVTGAGRLQECKKKFVWKLRKMGFVKEAGVKGCPPLRVSLRRASTVLQINKNRSNMGHI